MKKYLYRLWVSLLCISTGVALFFSVIALRATWNYLKWSGATTALAVEWRVKERSPSHYTLAAQYEYAVDGKVYTATSELKSHRFLNPFAAEQEKKNYPSKTWQVWYSPSHPQSSSLERFFPYKQILHALLTLGVLGYFYFVRGVLGQGVIEDQ